MAEEIIKPQTEFEEKKEVKEDVRSNSEFLTIAEAERKIKQMEELDKRLEEKNKLIEENLKKQESLIAESMLKGRGFAGTPPKTQDDEYREGAQKIASAIGRTI